jgi:hypothetical protein
VVFKKKVLYDYTFKEIVYGICMPVQCTVDDIARLVNYGKILNVEY